MTDTDRVLRQLEKTADRRRRAEEQREREMQSTARLLLEGADSGVPILHLAKAAGLTRQTVYDLLSKAQR